MAVAMKHLHQRPQTDSDTVISLWFAKKKPLKDVVKELAVMPASRVSETVMLEIVNRVDEIIKQSLKSKNGFESYRELLFAAAEALCPIQDIKRHTSSVEPVLNNLVTLGVLFYSEGRYRQIAP